MRRRCFIAAPGEASLGPLVGALQERGWETFALADVANLGSSLSRSLEDAVRSADVVIALIPDDREAANTAFEVGLAAGLGKPVVIVVSPEAVVPLDLQSFLQVRADVGNAEAIGLALDNVERYMNDLGRRDDPARRLERPIGEYADELLGRVRTGELSERDLESLVGGAIERSGAVVSAAAKPEEGFDLGVWSDDLDAIGANPILVEVKKEADSRAVRSSLLALQRVPGSRAALLVSLHDLGVDEMKWLRWPVLGISLEPLLRQMRDRSFAEVVRDLRNLSVHGHLP